MKQIKVVALCFLALHPGSPVNTYLFSKSSRFRQETRLDTHRILQSLQPPSRPTTMIHPLVKGSPK